MFEIRLVHQTSCFKSTLPHVLLIMAKVFDCITDTLQDFIAAQQIFFVATAPLSEAGRVNLSPKGLDSFRILSPSGYCVCAKTHFC